jgi:hypothetical protein
VSSEVRRFVRSAALFVLIGLALYGVVFAVSDRLVYQYGRYNRFLMIKTAPRADYDHVILGASHAAVFDYRDLNAELEKMTGSTILNLSVVGAGVTVNRLLFDYFLVGHRAQRAVYVLDSFAFYSRRWNEERLDDPRLFQRAPFDPSLAALLLSSPASRSTVADYITGFSKINNPDRFVPDTRADEGSRFERAYRPVAQIDQQRLEYLYPVTFGADAERDRYLLELEGLIRSARDRGIRVAIVRPPLPERVRRQIPGEAEFDEAVQALARRSGAALYDFSQVANDERFFFDTDHLNLPGVLNFFEHHLRHVLAP